MGTVCGDELVNAIKNGDEDKVRELLQNTDLDVNAVDSNGDTALHHATRNNRLAIVELLIERPDIKPYLENSKNETALKIAQETGSPITKCLREKLVRDAKEIIETNGTSGKRAKGFVSATFDGDFEVVPRTEEINDYFEVACNIAKSRTRFEAVLFHSVEIELKLREIEKSGIENHVVLIRKWELVWSVLIIRKGVASYENFHPSFDIHEAIGEVVSKIFKNDFKRETGINSIGDYCNSWLHAIKSVEGVVNGGGYKNVVFSEERQVIANILNEIQRTRLKMELCLKKLKRLNAEEITGFNYNNANVFLMFLETFALEDTYPVWSNMEFDYEKKKLLNDKIRDVKKKYFVQFFYPKQISNTRNTLLHSPKVIIQPKDVGNFTDNFFKKLEDFAESVFQKKDSTKFNLSFININLNKNQTTNYEKFFYEFIKRAYRNDTNLEELFFNYIVNISPELDSKDENTGYFNSLRNKLIHCFVDFQNPDDFKKAILDSQSKFYKYLYATKVNKQLRSFQKHPRRNINDVFDELNEDMKKLDNDFSSIIAMEDKVKDKFELKFEENVFCGGSGNLKEWVDLYLKLIPHVRDEGTSLYEISMILKHFLKLNRNEDDVLDATLKDKCIDYDDLSLNFRNNIVSKSKVDKISKILNVLLNINTKFKIDTDDLISLYDTYLRDKTVFNGDNKNIIEKYRLTIEKQRYIKGFLENIQPEEIGDNKILQLFFARFNKYYIKFNNLEEAFKDDTFLEYLIKYSDYDNVYIYYIIPKLLKKEYTAPYITALLENVGDIDEVIENEYLITLLEILMKNHIYTKYLSRLLLKTNTSINLYGLICSRDFKDNTFPESMHILLQEPQHVVKILSELKTPNNNNKLQKIIEWINTVAMEFRLEGDFKKSLEILQTLETNTLESFNEHDTLVLNARYQLAQAKILKSNSSEAESEKLCEEARNIFKFYKNIDTKNNMLFYLLYRMGYIHTGIKLRKYDIDSIHIYNIIKNYLLETGTSTGESFKIKKFNENKIVQDFHNITASEKYTKFVDECKKYGETYIFDYTIKGISHELYQLGRRDQNEIYLEMGLKVTDKLHTIWEHSQYPKLFIRNKILRSQLYFALSNIYEEKNKCVERNNCYYSNIMYLIDIYNNQNEDIQNIVQYKVRDVIKKLKSIIDKIEKSS